MFDFCVSSIRLPLALHLLLSTYAPSRLYGNSNTNGDVDGDDDDCSNFDSEMCL